MALLGYQIVITLIMASVIQKIGKHYSFAKWLLCNNGLVRYLYPTDSELRSLAGVPKEKKGKKDRRFFENGKTASSIFHVPRNLDIVVMNWYVRFSCRIFIPLVGFWKLYQKMMSRLLVGRVLPYKSPLMCLETTEVSILDVIHLRYFQDYQMLLDFSVYSMCIYFLTEVLSYFLPLRDEINLSMVWCFLVILFSTKILMSLTMQYFKGEESIGERSTVIVTFFVYLVLAMAILLIDEENLETGLERAYTSFNSSAYAFLEKHGLNSELAFRISRALNYFQDMDPFEESFQTFMKTRFPRLLLVVTSVLLILIFIVGPASKLILKFSIAIWCALIGALFTFPGLRMAKMHWDSIKYCGDRTLLSFLLNLNFAMPFMLVLLWLRPVVKHYLTVKVFGAMDKPLLTENAFDSWRVVLIVSVIIFRFAVMPLHLQAYLNIAVRKLEEQKKEAGRITNRELQKKVAAVFYYLCVVALQYLAPMLLCLFFALMYKTLGEFSWLSILERYITLDEECSVIVEPSLTVPLAEEESVLRSAQEITLAINSLKQVMTKEVARGVFGFATWWVCFAWFASSSLGLVYQTYFSIVHITS